MLDELTGCLFALLPWRVQWWITGFSAIFLIWLFYYLWSEGRLTW